jgi:hypothetical protein
MPHWDRLEEVRSWPNAHAKPFVSLGHLSARYSASVKVDPASRDAYSNLVAASLLPVGTMIAEFHLAEPAGQPGPIFAMQKLAEDRWEYLVVDPGGRVQKRGQLDLCQRCHAEGIADHLFGLPRSAN